MRPIYTHADPAVSRLLSRRRFLGAGAVTLGSALLPALAARSQPAAAEITTTDLGGGLFLFQGAGCNVVALRGADGALLIDGGLAANADALLRAVYAATGTDRVQTLINTHWHPEQTGANELVGRAGGKILAHEKTAMYLRNRVSSSTFEGRRDPLPEAARPTETTRGEGSLEVGGRKRRLRLFAGGAHGRRSVRPLSGAERARRRRRRLRRAMAAARLPQRRLVRRTCAGAREARGSWSKPDTRVVPADGRLITGRDVVRHRDIYRELFETMIGYMNMGFGAEDVVEHNPLAKYQSELGDPSAFLDGAYRSMLIAYVPD